MGDDVIVNAPFSPFYLRRWAGYIVIIIVVLIFIFSTFYTVGPDEVGVIKRFGRYVRTTQPGLHIKIPLAESVTKVKVKYVFKEEFGFRTLEPGVRTVYVPQKWEEESLMLTGDLNVVEVEWVVQYRIVDPYKYLFRVREIQKTIRDISESVVRLVVGDRSVDEVLTVGRTEVAVEAQRKLQEILDEYDIGVKIVTLKLKDVNPPDPVKPSFNEVNEARQDRERFINEAWQAYNQIIPKAKGEAEKMIAEAEGYAVRRVNTAKGDAERFTALVSEYKKAKEVTRKRIYLETLSTLLQKTGKIYIIDSEQKNILPLLSLEKEGERK
ncbi:FtsH protease activity modulator HflK [Candidatus Aerophobetes bacterium]|nr:FtsH protease activity modulator HflK [Candidatus Aerophobetes bacterium]